MISLLKFNACGIDISDKSIKYASLAKKGCQLVLDKYGEHSLPDGVINGGVIFGQDVLIGVLKKIKDEVNLDYVAVSLPEEKSYIVEMLMPKNISWQEYREAVELHLEERVPIEISKASFDYEEGGISKIAGFNLITSVVETELANQYYRSLTDAGLLPLVFELESQALARAIIKRGSRDISMIVDIGREQSNFSITVGEVVHLASSVNIGGNTLAKAIQDDLQVSLEEARKLKEEIGLLRKDKGQNPFGSIVRVATVLRDEIFQRLSFWNNSSLGVAKRDPITRVLLCGGNASIPGLAEYLTSDIGLFVDSANPWINILSFDDQIPTMTKRESLKYCTALGLALRVSGNKND